MIKLEEITMKKKHYNQPWISSVRIETASIICTSGGEQMTIGGANSPGGARAPQHSEVF